MIKQVELIHFDGLCALVKCTCGCLNRGRRFHFVKPCTFCKTPISFHDILKDIKNPEKIRTGPKLKEVKIIRKPIMKINIPKPPKQPKPVVIKVPKPIVEKKVRERGNDIGSPEELREQGKRIREKILKRKNLL